MSNLIRRKEYSTLEIEIFQAEEFQAKETQDQKAEANEPDREQQEDGLSEAEKRERLSTIEMEAYEKGFEQGQKDGLALGEKRIEEIAKRLEGLILELSKLKEQIYKESEQEILAVVLAIAKKILGSETHIPQETILVSIREATKFLTERSRVRILLHPDDLATIEEKIGQLGTELRIENLELVEDSSISRGGCILDTDFGKVNATIADQLDVLKDALIDHLNRNGHRN